MNLYEFIVSWKTKGSIQVAYACCNADSKATARRIIHLSVPYDLDLDMRRVKEYPYSKSRGENVMLWYFDENGVEHHDVFRKISE